jgi:DNA-binding CsgD family transcriptional regulator
MTQPNAFSEREKEVAALLLQGKSNKQIAQELGIATRTVEFHISHVYAKLGISSRAEAIIKLSENYLRESAGPGEKDGIRESAVVNMNQSTDNVNNLNSQRRIPMKPLFYIIGAGLLTTAKIFAVIIQSRVIGFTMRIIRPYPS